MRLSSYFIAGLLITSVVVSAHAKQIKDPYAALECPKLSLEQAVEIVKSGKLIDAIPHYFAFAQPAHPTSEIDKAVEITPEKPYEDPDGNVLCTYKLIDAEKRIVYELTLKVNYGVTEEPAER
jgi:hypothetical protein